MPESSRVGIHDGDRPELRRRQRGILSECSAVSPEDQPLTKSYLACPVRGSNEDGRDRNGAPKI